MRARFARHAPVVALVALVLIGSVAGLAAERSGRDARATFYAIGVLMLNYPLGGGQRLEIDAYAWVRDNTRTDATCPYFRATRRAGETTVRATCFPDSKGRPVRVLFGVHSTLWEGHLGQGIDDCRKRKDLKEASIVFTCTVTHDPNAIE